MNVSVRDVEAADRCGIYGCVVGNVEGRGGLSVGVVYEVSQDGRRSLVAGSKYR